MTAISMRMTGWRWAWGIIAAMTIAPAVSAEDISAFAEPYREIDLAPAESGAIAQVLITEGQQVTAGQLLATLNDQVLRASLRMADAAMNAHGKLHSTEAELRLHEQRLKKIIGLRERQHASQKEVEQIRSHKEIAAANLEAVHEELRIKSIEYERIDAQLQRRQLRSPIDGVVISIKKDVGEFVSANDPVVLQVIQLDPLLADFQLPHSFSGQFRVDQQVSILMGKQRREVNGVVEFVSPVVNPQSGTMRVKVRVPNPNREFPCGTRCRLKLEPSSADSPRQFTSAPRSR